jgi:hypothetical protein
LVLPPPNLLLSEALETFDGSEENVSEMFKVEINHVFSKKKNEKLKQSFKHKQRLTGG